MDQREDQLQALGICNKLYRFIKKALLTHAYKNVILGDSSYRNFARTRAKAAYESGQTMHSRTMEDKPCHVAEDQEEKGPDLSVLLDSSGNVIDRFRKELPAIHENEEKPEEEQAPLSPSVEEAKPPKKSVSINDWVEEITDVGKKKLGKKKSKEKLNLVEQEEEEEPKPLRSILKVGSYLDE